MCRKQFTIFQEMKKIRFWLFWRVHLFSLTRNKTREIIRGAKMRGRNIRVFDTAAGFASTVTRPACSRSIFTAFGAFNTHPLGWSCDRRRMHVVLMPGRRPTSRRASVQKRFARSSISRRAVVAFETFPLIVFALDVAPRRFDSTNRLDQVKRAISRILFRETRCSRDRRRRSSRTYQSSVKSLLHEALSAVHIPLRYRNILMCTYLGMRFVQDIFLTFCFIA